MNHKEWKMPPITHKASPALENAGYTPLLCEVLRARNIDTPEKAKKYLARDEQLICDPMLLEDLDKAVARIELAIREREKVAVYGDYDVDGISSSCLLCDYFRGRGLECEVYIPDRLEEGYGVNSEAIKALRERGVSLVVTVDCGITAFEEARLAQAIGIDVIITDHHECPQELPCAVAVVNPKRRCSKYPFDALAGVGVAFKLVCALEDSLETVLERYADLVAVGTVADVMPLTGENRALVHAGLEKLKNAPRPGFSALLEEAGVAQKPITTTTIGFILAPRINAAGRLSQTETSVGLLLSKTEDEARAYARKLCQLNRRRQELETEVWDAATCALGKNVPTSPIVLESDCWHPGVVGIAASKLSEVFRLPTVMICLDGDMGKGSCRSYGEFNIFDALTDCSEYLESFGGHAFAAGINIRPDKIDGFRRALAEYYKKNPPEEHTALEPELLIENLELLSIEGALSLDELEPFGCGNPRPLMCACDVFLENLTPIGNGKHLRLRICKNGIHMDCVFFAHSLAEVDIRQGELVDICFSTQINDFRSSRSVQLLVSDVRPAQSASSYKQIIEGTANPEEIRAFRPERDELARVWRIIKHMGGHLEQNLCELAKMSEFADITLVKLCLCLKIFDELKLLTAEMHNDHISAYICDNAQKTALDKSPLFRVLWAHGG